mmetsp:Transcript_6378/g.14422  ORF Transcript_6378/g.14422 Transcript_6378/m.14422 type:complete len:638 (+) Transcript_6378:45-1958(+)
MNSTPIRDSINSGSAGSLSNSSSSPDVVGRRGANDELFERVMPSAVSSGHTVSMAAMADLQASPFKPNNGSCGEVGGDHQETPFELMSKYHAAAHHQQQQSSPYGSFAVTGAADASKECGTPSTSLLTPNGSNVPETSNSNIDGGISTSPINSSTAAVAANKNQPPSQAQPNVFHGKGSFPLNLTLMLESVESINLSHVVSWLPSGESFVIHDPDLFLSEVLHKFFKSSKNTKIRSFYRKLNRWGFSILRGNHLQHQLVVAGMGGVVAGISTKGVWNHPDFCRSRAVECLNNALETGDAGCFLSVTHGGALGSSGAAAGSEGTARKRKNESALSPSLTDGANTAGSTEVPLFFGGGNHRPSHRESDFSLGDGSTDEFLLSQVTAQQAAISTALGHHQQASTVAAYGVARNSFTHGIPSPTPMQVSSAANMMDNRVPRSVDYNSTNFNYRPARQVDSMGGNPGIVPRQNQSLSSSFNSSFNYQPGRQTVAMGSDPEIARRQSQSISSSFNYQPIGQSGVMGGSNSHHNYGGRNQGTSASWTAGSTLSHQDFDFPSSYTLNNASHTSANALVQGEDARVEPLPFADNGNVDMMHSLLSMGHQQPPIQECQQGEEQGKEFTAVDFELASFFEKFADSLQK